MFGTSTPFGKKEIKEFIRERFSPEAKILDVGAGSGTYKVLLGEEYVNMDAIEVWEPAIENLVHFYRHVFAIDVRNFCWGEADYDLVIFGDILEHIGVEDAQKVISQAIAHSNHVLIGVPYNYKQGVLYGNEAEIHIQDDLNEQNFEERYPGFKRIIYKPGFYGYYYI